MCLSRSMRLGLFIWDYGDLKSEKDLAVSVGGVMPSKSKGRCLMPFDRTAPMAPTKHWVSPASSGEALETLLSITRLSGYTPCS